MFHRDLGGQRLWGVEGFENFQKSVRWRGYSPHPVCCPLPAVVPPKSVVAPVVIPGLLRCFCLASPLWGESLRGGIYSDGYSSQNREFLSLVAWGLYVGKKLMLRSRRVLFLGSKVECGELRSVQRSDSGRSDWRKRDPSFESISRGTRPECGTAFGYSEINGAMEH